MKHEIDCVLNAIQCARENARDANVELTTFQIYDVANSYINDNVISCECVERLHKRIEIEIRALYTNIHNFEFKIERIHDTTMHHVLFTFDEFIENETYKYVESMIIETNNVSQRDAFKNFYSLNNLYI
jgi:hypothetical protein